MKIYRLIPAAALLLAVASEGAAQTLHENVDVEGRYKPTVIVRKRLNMLPERPELRLTPTPLDYVTQGVVTDYEPDATAMPAMGWRDVRADYAYRGYLEASAGSFLNSRVAAGYRFGNHRGVNGGVWLRHLSTSLFRPDLSEATRHVRRRNYDETLGAYVQAPFSAGTLKAEACYHLAYFNYYGFRTGGTDEVKAPWQLLNDASARVGWQSEAERSLLWNASLGARYFGFRDFYTPGADGLPERLKGERETHLNLEAGLVAHTAEKSRFGIALDADWLLYNGLHPGPDNYGRVELNPYYTFTQGKLLIRAGATVDLSFRAGSRDNRFSTFHIAPDVRFDLRTGGVGMYLHLLGGTELNTLARAWELDTYTMPALATTRPVYKPLDAALGFNFGPFAGFSASVAARYALSRNVTAGGWYTAMLCGRDLLPGRTNNLSGLSLQARLAYSLGEVVSVEADASWQPQRGRRGYFNGYDRPRVTAGALLRVAPVKPLSIEVSYSYRGLRRIYGVVPEVKNPDLEINGESRSYRFVSRKLADLSMLGAAVQWHITPAFALEVRGDNLLNRRHALLPCLPGEGVSVTGGISLKF